ncbi:MAG: glutamate formimidoyltransferase [Lachnospiraceae bacterium]|jgi:glutamate formiminotransferase|nr:glutamate formimidoyltransferase [Lachnospiraceae bacterium]
MNPLMECVPNYSEGRDLVKIEKILDVFRGKDGVKLLDYSSDSNHNRTVVTVVGEPGALGDAVVESVGRALELIDMTKHEGQHPRMGAVDVIPFIPIRGCTMADADSIARETARRAAGRFGQPFFLYEESASAPHRKNLADIRKGQFEGMAAKMADPAWKPDFGPGSVHPTGGVTAIGARPPLIAFNVNLDTDRLDVAVNIAKAVRHIGGGLRCCKAMGVILEERGVAQVSINMTDYTQTAVYRIFEMVKMEARRYGAGVLGCEIVGLVPMQALLDCAAYYLQLEGFDGTQVLENRM